MRLHVKEHLAVVMVLELMQLLMFASLVVSGDPKQHRPVNELASPPSPSSDLLLPAAQAATKQKPREKQTGGLMIDTWALIARPEKRKGADYAGASSSSSSSNGAKKRRCSGGGGSGSGGAPMIVVRRRRGGPVELFPIALHQQSTNAAATKRDLHYKQQQGRTARGAADSGMITGDINSLQEKRKEGHFLPGQINALTTGQEDENAVFGVSSRTRERGAAFLPPRAVYVDTKLPEPFVRPVHQTHARLFGLTNFLIKGRPPMDPRSFGFLPGITTRKQYGDRGDLSTKGLLENAVDVESPRSVKSAEIANNPATTTELPETILNNLKDEVKRPQGYALYHRIVDSELEENDSPTMRNFEANSVVEELEEDLVTSSSTEQSENDDDGEEDGDDAEEEEEDWNSSETQQTRQVVDNFKSDRESENRWEDSDVSYDENPRINEYEFSYRVIDHASGSDFGHEESRRSGSGIDDGRMTNGRYHVLLPDGRVQRVKYFVDREGYHADVSYARPSETPRHTEEQIKLEEEDRRQ